MLKPEALQSLPTERSVSWMIEQEIEPVHCTRQPPWLAQAVDELDAPLLVRLHDHARRFNRFKDRWNLPGRHRLTLEKGKR
jgi:hypothetical protein